MIKKLGKGWKNELKVGEKMEKLIKSRKQEVKKWKLEGKSLKYEVKVGNREKKMINRRKKVENKGKYQKIGEKKWKI